MDIAKGMVGDFPLRPSGKNLLVAQTGGSGRGKYTMNTRIMGFLDFCQRR